MSDLWIVRMVEEQFHRDHEDRLLREARAPADCIRAGEIEYKPCPYSGSRAGGAPMNVSALRATSAHWDDIINALAYLRLGYTEIRSIQTMELMDIWRVSQLGSALPWYFILARGETCPAYAANLAKATLGMGLWGQRVFAKTVAESWTPPEMTAKAILALAEETGTLVGDTEVCSGPEKMLLRFFDALLVTRPEVFSEHMRVIEGYGDDILMFGAHYLNFKLALYILYLARRFVYADLAAALAGTPFEPELRELIDGPCEPPDFFTLGPTDLAATSLGQRFAWFTQLAKLVVPCSPEGDDGALATTMQLVALAMGTTPPADGVALAELPASADREAIARAVVTWTQLDTVLGEVMAIVETGFRRAAGESDVEIDPIDGATRDRVVISPARPLLASLGAIR